MRQLRWAPSNLAKLRGSLHLTQAEFVAIYNREAPHPISLRTYKRWEEQGHRYAPDTHQLASLSRIFHVDLIHLFEPDEPPGGSRPKRHGRGTL